MTGFLRTTLRGRRTDVIGEPRLILCLRRMKSFPCERYKCSNFDPVNVAEIGITIYVQAPDHPLLQSI
jgi:hypothetical protein